MIDSESACGELRTQIPECVVTTFFYHAHDILLCYIVIATFADGQLTDAIRHLASDSSTDVKVKRKLIAVLASWRNQFKDDHSMTLVANLYKQCRPSEPARRSVDHEVEARESEYEKRRREEKIAKEEAKKKAKLDKEAEKERLKNEEAARRQRAKDKTTRKPFNFEQVCG